MIVDIILLCNLSCVSYYFPALAACWSGCSWFDEEEAEGEAA